MWLANKYTKWYFSIIENAKQVEGEWHHIIPKSLGGSNDHNNLVLLNLREHFVCHILLPKMCIENQHIHKMIWALHKMTFSGNYTLNARYYEYVRKIHTANLILNHPAHINPLKFSVEQSKRAKKSYLDNPNLIKIRSEAMKMRLANTEFRENWNNHSRSICHIGGEAAKKKLKGTKRPEIGSLGNRNANALLYSIREPSGDIISITTEEMQLYCKNHKLNISSLKRHKKANGNMGIYQIIGKDFLRERRVGNV